MAKTAYNDTRLGLFVILAIAIFTYAMYRISNKADLFKGSIYLTATFNDVRGLQPGNNVRFAGITIGSVDAITVQGDTLVLVSMKVVEEVRTYMRKDAVADIGSNGLVGNMLVNIMPGPGKTGYVEDGDEIATISGWAGEMMGNLTTTSSDLISLTTSLNQIAEKINRGSGTISLLLNDETMATDLQAAIKRLRQTSGDLGLVAVRANDLMATLQSGQGVLGKLIADSASSERLDNILTSLDTLASSQVPQLLTDLQKSGSDLSISAERLKEIVDNLDKEGLTGSLLGDEERVKQLEQIMTNLEQGTDKFNTTMEALQHHWLLKRSVKKLQEGSDIEK